jgi:hypothetical protein
MTDKELLDLYSEYLISASRQTTTTSLSALLGGSICHDRIQRLLAGQLFTSADLCRYIKLESLKISTKLNHFALKSELYLRALQVAFSTVREAQSVQLAA